MTKMTVSDKLALARQERGAMVQSGGQGAALVTIVDDVVSRIGATNYDEAARSDLRALTLDVLQRDNKLISACQRSPGSFVSAFVQVLRLGLEVDPALQHVHLIPRKLKGGGVEVNLQLGYRGLLELVRRSKQVRRVWSRVVYSGDSFEVLCGTTEHLKHVPAFETCNVADYTHVYAVAELASGAFDFEVLTHAEVDRIEKKSQAGPVWNQWPAEMAKKTAIRRLCKRLPLSREVAAGLAVDAPIDSASPASGDSRPSVGGAPPVPILAPPTDEPGTIDVPESEPPRDVTPEPELPPVATLVDLLNIGAAKAVTLAAMAPCAEDPVEIAEFIAAQRATVKDVQSVEPVAEEQWPETHADALTWFAGHSIAAIGRKVGHPGADGPALVNMAQARNIGIGEVWDLSWWSAVRAAMGEG